MDEQGLDPFSQPSQQIGEQGVLCMRIADVFVGTGIVCREAGHTQPRQGIQRTQQGRGINERSAGTSDSGIDFQVTRSNPALGDGRRRECLPQSEITDQGNQAVRNDLRRIGGQRGGEQVDRGVSGQQGANLNTFRHSGDAKIANTGLRAEGRDQIGAMPIGIGLDNRKQACLSPMAEATREQTAIMGERPGIDLRPGPARLRHCGTN